jgi:hypothetical protein
MPRDGLRLTVERFADERAELCLRLLNLPTPVFRDTSS